MNIDKSTLNIAGTILFFELVIVCFLYLFPGYTSIGFFGVWLLLFVGIFITYLKLKKSEIRGPLLTLIASLVVGVLIGALLLFTTLGTGLGLEGREPGFMTILMQLVFAITLLGSFLAIPSTFLVFVRLTKSH